MNNSTSECSSRCESGWTTYLDQSSNYADQFYKADAGIVDKDYRSKVANVKEDKGAAEDLSMVSDASSGPPQFHEDENCFDESRYFGHASSTYEQEKKRGKKKKIKENRGKQQHSYLDDTASSPVLRFSENDIALSSNEASKEASQSASLKHNLKGNLLNLRSTSASCTPLCLENHLQKQPVVCREEIANEKR